MKRTIFNLFLTVITLAIVPAALFSQEVYTLEKAIEKAIENSYETKIAKLEVQKAEAAVDEAFGNVYPSVGVSSNFSHFLAKPKMPFPDFFAMLNNASYELLFKENVIPRDNSKFLPMENVLQSFALANNFEATAQVNQILFNSAVFKGIGASQLYYNTSQQALNAQIASKVSEVKKAFYAVLFMQNFYDITQKSYENARSNYLNVKALYENGLVAEFDALQAEVQVENILPSLIELDNNIKNTKDGLKMLMGVNPVVEIELAGSLDYDEQPLPAMEQAVETALKSNLDINTLEMKKQIDEAFIDLYRGENWPTLVAFGSASYHGTGDDLNMQTYNQAIVGLGFQMNLFNGFQTKNRVQQAKISALQTEQQVAQLRDAISMQVKSKLIELEKIHANIEARRRTANIAERAYSLASLRYKEGTGTQLEVQNADIALLNARVNTLQSIFDYKTAYAELQKLLGEVDQKYLIKY